MDLSCRAWEGRHVEFGIVCGVHYVAVRVLDGQGMQCGAFVDDWCVVIAEVGGATSVSNGERGGCGGGRTGIRRK